MQSHQNISHSVVHDVKISSPHLVKELAYQALKHVPGAKPLLDKHFNTALIKRELRPKAPINLMMHTGFDDR